MVHKLVPCGWFLAVVARWLPCLFAGLRQLANRNLFSNLLVRQLEVPAWMRIDWALLDHWTSPENRSYLQWSVPRHSPYCMPSGPIKVASCCIMELAKSSVLQVAFEVVVQASLAALAAHLAEISALANAAGSIGTSTSSTGLWSFLILLMLTLTILVPKSTETNFPLIHFPPCEPSDFIFDLSSVQ